MFLAYEFFVYFLISPAFEQIYTENTVSFIIFKMYRTFFSMGGVLILEGLVGPHRTVQLLQHYWSGHRLGLL